MSSKISTLTAAIAAFVVAFAVPATAQTKPSAGPATTLPTRTVAPHPSLLPPRAAAAPPPGTSVTLQNCSLIPGAGSGAPYPIGMASAFNLNTSMGQSGPTAGFWAGAQVGTGTIQFGADNTLALLLSSCNAQRILPRMTITNVTSTGTVVYDMPSVLVTSQQLGSTISYSFHYMRITWTVTSPGGTWLSSTTCEYSGGMQRGCR